MYKAISTKEVRLRIKLKCTKFNQNVMVRSTTENVITLSGVKSGTRGDCDLTLTHVMP